MYTNEENKKIYIFKITWNVVPILFVEGRSWKKKCDLSIKCLKGEVWRVNKPIIAELMSSIIAILSSHCDN